MTINFGRTGELHKKVQRIDFMPTSELYNSDCRYENEKHPTNVKVGQVWLECMNTETDGRQYNI